MIWFGLNPFKWCLALLALLGLLCSTWLFAAESSPEMARDILEKWVDAKKQAGRAASEWEQSRAMLQHTIALLRDEKELLENEIGEIKSSMSRADQEKARLAEEGRNLKAIMRALQEKLERSEREIQRQVPLFPGPLQESLEPLLLRIPKGAERGTPAVSARLQNVIAILNEIEEFNSRLTLVTEFRTNPDREQVQVKTLYVGLAQAYFVNAAGNFAGIGSPGENGWDWKTESTLAPRIQRAMNMFENRGQAEFVPLPVRLK